jgi:hypothetical protein
VAVASSTRLRRPLYARLFGTVPQGVLSIYGLLSPVVFFAVLANHDWSQWPSLVALAALDLLWVRGLTAWAAFDASGIQSRFWVRSDYPWETIHSVTLLRLENFMASTAQGPPAIVVTQRGSAEDGDVLAPVRRCGRRRQQFATELLVAAQAHRVEVRIGSTGWHQAQETEAEPFE